MIDLGAEKVRLDKELAKANADIQRVDAKLGMRSSSPTRRKRSSKSSARSARKLKAARPRSSKLWSGSRARNDLPAVIVLQRVIPALACGNGLRLTILAIPPVLALIIVDLKLSGTEVGILNAIPVSLFALVAVPGSLLIARVGAVPAP